MAQDQTDNKDKLMLKAAESAENMHRLKSNKQKNKEVSVAYFFLHRQIRLAGNNYMTSNDTNNPCPNHLKPMSHIYQRSVLI